MVMFTENLCDYFISLQLFVEDNSKTKTHQQKYSESKYIACGFYFLFCAIVIVYKTFVGCYTIRGIYFYRLFTHWRAAKSKSIIFIRGFFFLIIAPHCVGTTQSVRTNCFHAIFTGLGLSRFRNSVLYQIPFVI